MPQSDADRAARIMSGSALPVLPLERLAELLYPDGSADRAASALAGDPRFRIITGDAPVPDMGAWPPALRPRYASAFRRAGLRPTRTVLLLSPASPSGRPGAGPCTADLLRDTLAELLATCPPPPHERSAPAAADGSAIGDGATAAELARAAVAAGATVTTLSAVTSGAARSSGAAPSTTPPPGSHP